MCLDSGGYNKFAQKPALEAGISDIFENPRQQRSILLITNCFCHKESHYQAKLIFGKTQNLILETLKINFWKNSTLIVGLLDCFIFFPKKVQRGKAALYMFDLFPPPQSIN